MMDEETRRAFASLAKLMALTCVRNTKLEDIHAGTVPVTRTGDYSDVAVIDADGRRIPWPEVSHFDDDAMRDLMRQVVDRLYTFHVMIDDPQFQAVLDRWQSVIRNWDEPTLDAGLMEANVSRRAANTDDNRGSGRKMKESIKQGIAADTRLPEFEP